MPQPQLGYGHQTEATIDQVNQWMRAQPWWQQIKGQSGDISDQQKRAIMQAAQQNGVVIDQGDMEIDRAGNLNPKGHKLRNTLIVAGIAGATIATMGAAGAFSGVGSTAATAGTTAATGTGLAAVEGGAYGLSAEALAALGSGAMSAVPVTAATGAGLTASEMAAGGGGAWDAAGNFIGDSTYGSVAGGSTSTNWLNTAGRVANALGNYAGGRQADRVNEAQIGIGQNQNIISLYSAQQNAANAENTYGLNKANTGVNVGNLDLNQRKYALDAPGQRAGNAVRGDILANAQDVHIQAPSTIPETTVTGGLRPSMFSANTRALGGLMSQQALAGQKAGDTFAPLPTVPDYKPGPTAPSLTGMPQATGLDTFLNTAATIGSLGGAMGAIPYKRVPQPGDPDYVPPTARR